MLFRYFLNVLEMVPAAPVITVITFVVTFHVHCISVVRSLYFRNFLASFLITFLSSEIATFINIHDLFIVTDFVIVMPPGDSSDSNYTLPKETL